MLKHAKGNVLDMAEQGQFGIVLQGCNCFNTMGGGIAREIAARYPLIEAEDKKTARGDITKLGNWTRGFVECKDSGFWLYNCYTQFDMSNGQDVFEYDAFSLILYKLLKLYPSAHYGLPYIGMGLARGNPGIIVSTIEAFAEDVTDRGGSVTLVEFA